MRAQSQKSRRIAWLVAACALAVLVASARSMAVRVSDFHRTSKRETFAFKPVGLREFTYANRPVSITDETDTA